MAEELLIPFPPTDYPCRDGKEIKTWMDGYEAALVDLKLQDKPLVLSVSDFDWIQPNIQAWMQSAILFPVEVTIINSNTDKKEALVKNPQQEGWVEWNRLYKSKDECPCR